MLELYALRKKAWLIPVALWVHVLRVEQSKQHVQCTRQGRLTYPTNCGCCTFSAHAALQSFLLVFFLWFVFHSLLIEGCELSIELPKSLCVISIWHVLSLKNIFHLLIELGREADLAIEKMLMVGQNKACRYLSLHYELWLINIFFFVF